MCVYQVCMYKEEEGGGVEGVVIGCRVMKHTHATPHTPAITHHNNTHHKHTHTHAPHRGKGTQAFAPRYPLPKQEEWWLALGEPSINAQYCLPLVGPVSLLEAERAGIAVAQQLVWCVWGCVTLCVWLYALMCVCFFMWPTPNTPNTHTYTQHTQHTPNTHTQNTQLAGGYASRNSTTEPPTTVAIPPTPTPTPPDTTTPTTDYLFQEGDSPTEGQLVTLRFRAPKAGKRQLMLYILCDSWVGVDRAIPLKVKIAEQSRAEQEGRTVRAPKGGTGGDGGGVEAGEGEAGAGGEGEEEEEVDSEVRVVGLGPG